MLTNIDLEKMNHLMETNKDAKEIITQLLKNHDAAVATIAHEIRNPMTVLYSSMQLMSSLYAETAKGSCVFEKSKIEMTSSIDKNIKRFNGDRTKLEEVFLNILTNAKDALADCKYAPRLQFRAKKLDDKILIQCQDNGCGIPTEIVDKLYEPFFTTKENGTGLGLAVSKRIIEAHNGTIDITSDHTNGTIVSITLPA